MYLHTATASMTMEKNHAATASFWRQSRISFDPVDLRFCPNLTSVGGRLSELQGLFKMPTPSNAIIFTQLGSELTGGASFLSLALWRTRTHNYRCRVAVASSLNKSRISLSAGMMMIVVRARRGGGSNVVMAWRV